MKQPVKEKRMLVVGNFWEMLPSKTKIIKTHFLFIQKQTQPLRKVL